MGSSLSAMLPAEHALGSPRVEGVDEETALRSFDAYFLGEMLRRAVPKDSEGLLDGGQAGRMYRDFLFQELARIAAADSDFGLARSLEGRLSGASVGSEPTREGDPSESRTVSARSDEPPDSRSATARTGGAPEPREEERR